jgi:hypothetical protein
MLRPGKLRRSIASLKKRWSPCASLFRCLLEESTYMVWSFFFQARVEFAEGEKKYLSQISEIELSKQRLQADLDASISSAHSVYVLLASVEGLAAQLEKGLDPAVAGISQMHIQNAGAQVARQHLECILRAEKERVIELELSLEERIKASDLAVQDNAELSLRLKTLTEEKSELSRQVGECAWVATCDAYHAFSSDVDTFT